METIYKTFRAEIKDFNDETGEVNLFIPLSSSEWDRDQEVVEPTSIKKHLPKFMKHPVLVASHDYRDLTNQIGEWQKIKIVENGTEGKPKYYIGMGNEQADWAFKLATMGAAAFSYGFIPKVWEDGDGVKSPRRTYKEIELLEISQVIIPSNRQAIMEMRAKSIDPIVCEICDEIESELEDEPEIVEEKEIITKPEISDEFIRIPVRTCEVTATIDISKKEGISALYCGKEKQVRTYLFRKDKGWTMAKAKAWVKEHEKKVAHDVSQAEIIDEIDYLKELIEKDGLSKEGKESFEELMRVSGYDNPVDIETHVLEVQRDNPSEMENSLKLLDEIIKEQLEVK